MTPAQADAFVNGLLLLTMGAAVTFCVLLLIWLGRNAGRKAPRRAPAPPVPPLVRQIEGRCQTYTGADGIRRVDTRGRVAKTHTPIRAATIAGLNPKVWGQMLAAFEYRCRYCGTDIRASRAAVREHRIPLARGGRNEAANIVPACQSCNRGKHITTEDEYLALMRRKTGNPGWMPDTAVAFLAEVAETADREDRAVTLMREVMEPNSPHDPWPAPSTAVLLDPPPLVSYTHTDGEIWATRSGAVSLHSAASHEQAIRAVVGKNAHEWAGWGYLLPGQATPDDPEPTHLWVIARGKTVAGVPGRAHPAALAAAQAAWAGGQVPVVRACLLADPSRVSVAVHLEDGSLSTVD